MRNLIVGLVVGGAFGFSVGRGFLFAHRDRASARSFLDEQAADRRRQRDARQAYDLQRMADGPG